MLEEDTLQIPDVIFLKTVDGLPPEIFNKMRYSPLNSRILPFPVASPRLLALAFIVNIPGTLPQKMA